MVGHRWFGLGFAVMLSVAGCFDDPEGTDTASEPTTEGDAAAEATPAPTNASHPLGGLVLKSLT